MENFKEGDFVNWICRPYLERSFECFGKIVSFKPSTFGAKKKTMGVKILVNTEKYFDRMGKQFAFVSIDKIYKKSF